jgi:hypothetical protein
MTGHDREIEELRDKVHCAVVLERTPPPWKLDRKESTRRSLKYRRGKREILIVSHGGKGWWDPTSEARGDVFGLVQRLEPGLNFGHVRKRLREFAGLSPSFPAADRAGRRTDPNRPAAERWAERKAVRPNSPAWRFLSIVAGMARLFMGLIISVGAGAERVVPVAAFDWRPEPRERDCELFGQRSVALGEARTMRTRAQNELT